MKCGFQMAAAIGAGYLLGRSHKMRTAALLALTSAAGGALPIGPEDLLSKTPLGGQLDKLTGDLRGQLVDAGMSVAKKAASSRIDSLSDRLAERADSLRGTARRREEEPEEEAEEERPRPRRERREPERRRREDRGERGRAEPARRTREPEYDEEEYEDDDYDRNRDRDDDYDKDDYDRGDDDRGDEEPEQGPERRRRPPARSTRPEARRRSRIEEERPIRGRSPQAPAGSE
jgi:hypothetical protein